MKLSSIVTHRLVLASVLACAALPLTSRAQASASARIENNLSGSGHHSGIAAPVNTGPSRQEAVLQDSASDGTIIARSNATDGVIGAYTEIHFSTENFNSGGLDAVATGRWNDVFNLVIPSQFALPNVAFFQLDYSAEAHGGVAATGSFDSTNHALALGTAAVDYAFNFGGNLHTGSQSYSSLSGRTETGTWGTITGGAIIGPNQPVALRMTGSAYSSVGNFFNFGPRTASSEADFGSTLIWGGITHVTAFNVSGQVLQLPDDFYLDLIGQQSGFNYWYAAEHPHPPSGVPDSGSAVMMLAPVVLCAAMGRRLRQGGASGA